VSNNDLTKNIEVLDSERKKQLSELKETVKFYNEFLEKYFVKII